MSHFIYENIVVEACTRESALATFTALSSSEDLADKLMNLRKILLRRFNASQGSTDSILKIKCNSKVGVTQLQKLLEDSRVFKRVQREYRVTPKFTENGLFLQLEFEPNSPILKWDNSKLSLSQFLKVSKNKETLQDFITKNNLENKTISLGSPSVQSILDICTFLSRFKNRLFVDFE